VHVCSVDSALIFTVRSFDSISDCICSFVNPFPSTSGPNPCTKTKTPGRSRSDERVIAVSNANAAGCMQLYQCKNQDYARHWTHCLISIHLFPFQIAAASVFSVGSAFCPYRFSCQVCRTASRQRLYPV